ncbi:MAG: carbohydrate binding domain-containing protein [Sedimentisphaerales bacterium]|nr:carbohydrate binding domain-containing protein [Sedimentisphaerales bacterium]
MKTGKIWLTVFLLIGFTVFSPSHAQENILVNGGFETGAMDPWSTYGSVTTEVVDRLEGAAVPEGPIEGDYALHLVVPGPGANFWDAGLQHTGHVFEAGKKYTLSVFLKSKEGDLQINFKPELAQDPWTGYGSQAFTMSEEWTEFSITTPVFTEDVSPAAITFHIQYAAGDFWIDGVRFYEGDYVEPAFSSFKAREPEPENGALHKNTWASLSWEAGKSALTHDIYFGDNFEDVNNRAESVFQGNVAEDFYVVGFPGFVFPDGLVPGTTYYWRVDEINENDPNSPWSGEVWSFLVPSRKAYNPTPADGAKFIEQDVILEWSPGLDTKIHRIYFGDNFADVDAGTGDTSKGPVGGTDFSPGTLELEKTYYWRVDEFDGLETHKGDIWTFTVTREGGGVRADYFQGMNFENQVLNRIDPQIDFNWGDPGGPDPLVGDDNFSVRWSGQVEAAFTETYTFYARTDDGVRLWVDGVQLIDRWVDRSVTENKGTIDLIAGQSYGIIMEYYENVGGAVAELSWSSPRTPKQIIPQAALSLPVKASNASPRAGSIDVKQTIILTWAAGDFAESHDVYFGTDEEAVRNADRNSPEYKGSKALGSESYDPGLLEWGTTYYWRVDEINNNNPDSPWAGGVWSFTTANFLIVDDMEAYNDLDPSNPASNRIFNAWLDGYDNPAINGSIIGYANPPFAEKVIVHSGSQSMPFEYNNGVGKSEATLMLTNLRNWTQNDVDTLIIWHLGDPANAAEPMYAVLNNSASVTNPNPNAAQIGSWTEWKIPLQQFADQGINLTNVTSITIGFGNRANPTAGGAGMMYFDDIRISRSTSVSGEFVNLFTNGGFEEGVLEPWNVYGEVTTEVVSELTDAAIPEAVIEGETCLHIVVPEAGDTFYSIGLQYTGLVFETGKKYTLSAFLKSKSGPLDINFKPELAADPYTGYGSQAFTITEEWAEYNVTTAVMTEDVSPAGVTFHIGYTPGNFWIDGVRFYEGDYVVP